MLSNEEETDVCRQVTDGKNIKRSIYLINYEIIFDV